MIEAEKMAPSRDFPLFCLKQGWSGHVQSVARWHLAGAARARCF